MSMKQRCPRYLTIFTNFLQNKFSERKCNEIDRGVSVKTKPRNKRHKVANLFSTKINVTSLCFAFLSKTIKLNISLNILMGEKDMSVQILYSFLKHKQVFRYFPWSDSAKAKRRGAQRHAEKAGRQNKVFAALSAKEENSPNNEEVFHCQFKVQGNIGRAHVDPIAKIPSQH